MEIRAISSGGSITKQAPLPPTPASSTTSVAEDNRRSTRQVRGTGQVPLSRPKTRQPQKAQQAKKRFRLDSDDEDEAAEKVVTESARLVRTPSKRLRRGEMVSPVRDPSLPAIVIQAPTPLKVPLPPPLKTLPGGSGSNHRDRRGYREGSSPSPTGVKEEEDEHRVMANYEESERPEEDNVEVKEENIVPSPSTENDPPLFSISQADPVTTDLPSRPDEDEDTGAVRALRPVASFEDFTLWTPDAPLPGFRADELEVRDQAGLEGRGEGEEDEGKDAPDGALRRGWWRTGGAGEGGDEMVRAMGEWLGLVEMVISFLRGRSVQISLTQAQLNRPVYLEGPEDDDSDDDC